MNMDEILLAARRERARYLKETFSRLFARFAHSKAPRATAAPAQS